MITRTPIEHFTHSVRVARRAAPGYWSQYRRERRRIISPAPFKPAPDEWPDTGLHAAWLGHSTALIKLDGFTVLTDPVLGMRCGVNIGPMTVGLKRMVEPALSGEELPPIDLVLLSHAHFDHLDRPTLRVLASKTTQVITADETRDLLRIPRWKGVQELKWGESMRVGPALITALRVEHWGARMRTDTYRGYNGYLIETGRHRVVFGGDTALTDSFRTIRSKKPVDVAVMPIGAYDPWIHVHCTPEQAWKMAQDCRAEFILPVHHQTFYLSREPRLEPIERLRQAAKENVVLGSVGEEWHQR